MSLTVRQTLYAVSLRTPVSFLGNGGVEPYMYSVLPGGAGGTINPTTGVYTTPTTLDTESPLLLTDTIQVTDYAAATATATLMIGTPILLLCEIIQREMSLASGRVYLWDQKIKQPTDSGIYVAVSVPRAKVIGNVNSTQTSGGESEAFLSMAANVDIDIISRSMAAYNRKEEVVLALKSIYSQQQQEANSFAVSSVPTSFINLSSLDGAAIPYRYKISCVLFYAYKKNKAVPYFDDFSEAEVTTDT